MIRTIQLRPYVFKVNILDEEKRVISENYFNAITQQYSSYS